MTRPQGNEPEMVSNVSREDGSEGAATFVYPDGGTVISEWVDPKRQEARRKQPPPAQGVKPPAEGE